MDLKYQKLNVIYKDRKAVLTGYFDQICLFFDKKDGMPDMGNIKVSDNYDEGYHVFFSRLPIEERKKIQLENKEPLFKDCVCSLIIDDRPDSDLLSDHVEIIGDDPIDHEVTDEFADFDKYATVKCRSCGKVFKVSRNMGYRSAYYRWMSSQDK